MRNTHISKSQFDSSEPNTVLVILLDIGLLFCVLMLIGLFFQPQLLDWLKIETGPVQIIIRIVMWIFGLIGALVVLVIVLGLAVHLAEQKKRKEKEQLSQSRSRAVVYDDPGRNSSEAEQDAVCPDCNGTGMILMTYTGYNRNTIGSQYEMCERCKGTGRDAKFDVST